MKPRLKISPTLLAVAGCVMSLWGVYELETLALSSTETLLVSALAVLILGSFLVSMAYAQSLLCERKAPQPEKWEKLPPADVRE